MTPRLFMTLALVLTLFATQAAPAQSQPIRAPDDEATPDPTADSVEILESPPSSGQRVESEGGSAVPGMALPADGPGTGSLLPEGAYLLERRGIVVPIGERHWAYVFDADDEGESEPPMYLVPCLQLSEMVHLVRTRAETITFFIDGEVFVYAGHNYLLPLRYKVGAEEDFTRAEETEAALDANRSLRPDKEDPSVESLMERLDRASSEEGDRGAPIATPGPDSGPNLVPELTTIVSRRGRMARIMGVDDAPSGATRWTFMPDNDTAEHATPKGEDDDDPSEGRAFLLQPCLNTQEIERLAELYADRVVFVISGAVYLFEGENYLLPTMYLIEQNRDANLSPAQ